MSDPHHHQNSLALCHTHTPPSHPLAVLRHYVATLFSYLDPCRLLAWLGLRRTPDQTGNNDRELRSLLPVNPLSSNPNRGVSRADVELAEEVYFRLPGE